MEPQKHLYTVWEQAVGPSVLKETIQERGQNSNLDMKRSTYDEQRRWMLNLNHVWLGLVTTMIRPAKE